MRAMCRRVSPLNGSSRLPRMASEILLNSMAPSSARGAASVTVRRTARRGGSRRSGEHKARVAVGGDLVTFLAVLRGAAGVGHESAPGAPRYIAVDACHP